MPTCKRLEKKTQQEKAMKNFNEDISAAGELCNKGEWEEAKLGVESLIERATLNLRINCVYENDFREILRKLKIMLVHILMKQKNFVGAEPLLEELKARKAMKLGETHEETL